MKPTIYVITAYKFNHSPYKPSFRPLDRRFLETDKNYTFFLIDDEIPDELKGQKVLQEKTIDPILAKAGKEHLAEWSFLLAEAKHGFCEYPFFMISSRFYEKNKWLTRDLNQHWDVLFSQFQDYGWGFLPSYDRPLRWIDLDWKKSLEKKVWRYKFFPFTKEQYLLVDDLYGIKIPEDYRYTADLLCNYVGFRSRKELLEYVEFYRPIIDFFFDENFEMKNEVSRYIKKTGFFRKEKPFTFILEQLCHLFFYANKKEYFALHYDGYYKINEKEVFMQKFMSEKRPLFSTIKQLARWQFRRLTTEGGLTPLRNSYSKLKKALNG